MELAYISCPLTLGNANHNWFQAAEAQRQLMLAGYAVHNPAHALMFPAQRDFTWEQWLQMDEAIILRCDLIVLLPGESRGAERECRYAESIGLPILTLEQALERAAAADLDLTNPLLLELAQGIVDGLTAARAA